MKVVTPTVPKVSVVTPFYNTDAYLSECIESVLAQSYTNFEFILVDNQSTDRSAEIAASYAARDRRIRLVRTPRLFDQVANYNFALSQIAPDSEYCKICQADDWLYPRCLAEMIELAERHPTTGVVSSLYLREAEVMNVGLHPSQSVLSGRDAARFHLIDEVFLFGSPTTVLYRASQVRARQPFYEAGRLHEDTEVVFELLKSNDFGFVHQVLSFARLQGDSITGVNRDLLPEALDRVIAVRRFGREFLTVQEYEDCWARAQDVYYRALARRLLRGLVRKTSKGFWSYQREGLATVGETLRVRRLGVELLRALLEGALNPLDTLGAALRIHGRRAVKRERH